MANDEDFEKLFDGSILESLEGALHDISLQMRSSNSDLINTTEVDVVTMNSDDSSMQDDDAYTNDTYDTGFTSEEEEDPDTGEQELFAMMEDLVAELESEMEFFEDKRNDLEELPTVPQQEQNEEQLTKPEADSHSHHGTSDQIDSVDYTNTLPVGLSQDHIKSQRAKSFLKVLSGLAPPDELKESGTHISAFGSDILKLDDDTTIDNENSRFEQTFDNENNTQMHIQKNFEVTSDACDNMTKSAKGGSPRATYVPTEADFKHFVGVLAEYSKRRRRAQAQGNKCKLVTAHTERSRDPYHEDLRDRTDSQTTYNNLQAHRLHQLPHAKEEDNVAAQDQRKKTSRAIANFTLKKRREYMQRKSQSRNTGIVASVQSTSFAATTLTNTSGGRNLASSHTNTAENVRRASPTKKKVKRRRRRTNKHMKGNPKKHTCDLSESHPTDNNIPVSVADRSHSSIRERSNCTREEVIRALAKTELWQWLVTQVQEGNDD